MFSYQKQITSLWLESEQSGYISMISRVQVHIFVGTGVGIEEKRDVDFIHRKVIIKASEMLVAPRISECFDLL